MKIRFGAGLVDEHRQILATWVQENGLDPSDVPLDATFVIEGGTLTVDVYVRNEQGRMVIDPTEPNQVMRELRTVPLRAPWPGISAPA